MASSIARCVAHRQCSLPTAVSKASIYRASRYRTDALGAANVDWALLNFMKDWFPGEARKKLQQNEREAAEEEMTELGLEMRGCLVM